MTDVKVAQLGRDGFKRLLGPVEDIMRRAEYGTTSTTGTTTTAGSATTAAASAQPETKKTAAE
ncbi:hypothetical protein EMPG_16718 [Blastomyces silverae]|uniref:Cyclic nucleotide-binding domain-containing protein n=1 Tax=Blastomyces silverae TaxID=2060906 RepID=A0A0H1B9S6_9EURO|nr:hypothetical protein EMPG_16718 [Blastomyces silverae]